VISMNKEAWDDAQRRRAEKFEEIVRLLSNELGSDVDAEQEAKEAIEQWEETVEMEDAPTSPATPLQSLLREYHDICEEILDIEVEEHDITLTDAERQFIEIMRERKPTDNLKVTIELVDGAWEVSMSLVIEGRLKTIHGTGRTFGEAWESAER